jgi:chaperone BCS1
MESYKFKITSGRLLIEKFVNHLRSDGKEFVYNGYSKNENDEIELDLLIPAGKTEIDFKSHKFVFDLIEYDDIHGINFTTAKHEELFLTIFCKSKEEACSLFKNFICDVDEFTKEKKIDTVQVSIYKAGSGWITLSRLPNRSMETIYFDKLKKINLIKDIIDFYTTEKEYHKFGIPYTKKYLFEGPSGTGKTSLIFALASHFNKSISMISFNQNLDDASLMNVINRLESDTFLVLEDVDALFTNREERSPTNNSDISFSGLLNALDGFGRKDKLVIFMTTNHLNKLDETQIRPGRVDYIVSFDNPNEEQIKEMFDKFLPNQTKNFQKFYDTVSHKKISVALLQKFLFDNRDCDDISQKIPDFNKLINIHMKNEKNIYI